MFARVDDSNTSIGKRYARNDELGTPFGVTLDFACDYIFVFHFGPTCSDIFFASITKRDHDASVGGLCSYRTINLWFERKILTMITPKLTGSGTR